MRRAILKKIEAQARGTVKAVETKVPQLNVDQELSEDLKSMNLQQEDNTNSHFKENIGPKGANFDAGLQPAQLVKKQHQPEEAAVSISKSSDAGAKADFDPSLPPAQLAKEQHQPEGAAVSSSKGYCACEVGDVPHLVFWPVPRGLTEKAIFHLCSNHVRVKLVHQKNEKGEIVVELFSEKDMKTAYTALFLGFAVKMSRPKAVSAAQIEKELSWSDEEVEQENSDNKPVADDDFRKIRDFLVQNNCFELPPALCPSDHENASDAPEPYRVDQQNASNAHELQRAGQQIESNAHKEVPDQNAGQLNANDYNGNMSQAPVQPREKGECAVCDLVCELVCKRCSTFFCSLSCQTKAWPMHRYICGRPKHLQLQPPPSTDQLERTTTSITSVETECSSGAALNREMQIPFEMPSTGSLVTMSCIRKTNLVFIRSQDRKDKLTFCKIRSDILELVNTLEPLSELPKCGQILIGRFKEQFSRALVLDVQSRERIRVNYIDYGNIEYQDLSDFYVAPEHLVKLKRLAVPVLLKNVPASRLTAKIYQFMNGYLEWIEFYVHFTRKEDKDPSGIYRVELIDAAAKQNFNEMVAAVERSDIFCYQYLTHYKLPSGDNVKLFIMNNSLMSDAFITCTTPKHAVDIFIFERELQVCAELLADQSYSPHVNEVCIAKYGADQKWHRAYCIVPASKECPPSMVFFDYGYDAYVDIKNIRQCPRRFTLPIYSSPCSINGIPYKCDDKLKIKLEALIPSGQTITCDHVENTDHQFSIITLNYIVKELKKNHLLPQQK